MRLSPSPARSRALGVATCAAWFALGALPAARGPAAGLPAECDFHPLRIEEAIARHELHSRLAAGSGSARALQASRHDEVAVIQDDGTAVLEANPFDLAHRALSFEPAGRRYRVRDSRRRFKSGVGQRLRLAEDEVVEVPFAEGFRFPFGGESYDSVFVHSDGALTFGARAAGILAPSIASLLEGVPTFAPLLADLRPERLAARAGIFANVRRRRVVLTWRRVPSRWVAAPDTVGNTFQVTLFASGKIAVVFREVSAQEAVVGLAPGRGPRLRLVDYSVEAPTGALRGAIGEIFTAHPLVDTVAVLRAFYSRFEDRYGSIALYYDFPTPAGRLGPCPPFCPLPFELNIANDVAGIGLERFDASALFGSAGRLRSLVYMGDLASYAAGPDEPTPGRTFTPMGVLAHEISHRWLAWARARDPWGEPAYVLTQGGRPGHWSTAYDSAGSINGFRIDLNDHGNGTFSHERVPFERFSALDQYLMGLRSADEVAESFYLDREFDFGQLPSMPFAARRFDTTIRELREVEGPRDPAPASGGTLHLAFILLTRQGETPSEETLAKISRFQRRFEEFFGEATEGRGRVRSRLRER